MATRIGLTSFIDYFSAQSPTKVARVRAAKRMMEGDGFDHWLLFRQAAVEAFVAGGDRQLVSDCVDNAVGTRQAATYRECGRALNQWFGRKQIAASPLGRGKIWSKSGLEVSVNPELRVSINGGPQMNLKLYFKSEVLSKRAADPMLRLVEQTYGQRSPAAILDVRRRKLFTGPAPKPGDLDLLLEAEARGFATIWRGL